MGLLRCSCLSLKRQPEQCLEKITEASRAWKSWNDKLKTLGIGKPSLSRAARSAQASHECRPGFCTAWYYPTSVATLREELENTAFTV